MGTGSDNTNKGDSGGSRDWIRGFQPRENRFRWLTFMQVPPPERSTFVQVLPPERILPLEATAGGLQLASRPLGRPCLPAGPIRLHSFAPTPVHPLTPPLPLPGSSRPARGGAVRSRREHRSSGLCTGGSKRSRFVTGAPPAVKRHEAAKGGPKRPFRDTKRVTAS